MATYTILYWQDIPSFVEAKEGEDVHKIQLSDRYQALIDAVAMEKGLAGTDAYLDAWVRGAPIQREGSAKEVAIAVQQELEDQFASIKATAR